MTEKLSPYEQMLLYRDELGIEGAISKEEATEELILSHKWMREQLGFSMQYLYELEKMGIILPEENTDIPDIENLVAITNTFRIQREAMLKVIKAHKLDKEYALRLKEQLAPQTNKNTGTFAA
jgi:hypothetical protein